jgi:hypothetical protein
MGPENEGFGYFGAASHLFIFRWSYFPFICILIAGLRIGLTYKSSAAPENYRPQRVDRKFISANEWIFPFQRQVNKFVRRRVGFHRYGKVTIGENPYWKVLIQFYYKLFII